MSTLLSLSPLLPAALCQPCRLDLCTLQRVAPWVYAAAASAEALVRSYSIAELTQAAHRVAELTRIHGSWPQARVRATVARELNLSTAKLRYMLRKAAAVSQTTPAKSEFSES